MKIAHISDLHLNTFYKNSNFQAIKYLIKYSLQTKADHIVISGDLTDSASPKDFEILRNLFKTYNLLDGSRLSVTIGNHDIFGGLQSSEDILRFPEKCRLVDYHKMVEEFGEYFSETFSGSVNGIKYFPYVKELNSIQLIGINSNAEYSKMKNPFASNGRITEESLIETNELIEACSSSYRTRIALFHHHFNRIKSNNYYNVSNFWQKLEKQTMKLKKKKRIVAFFKENDIELVLHGHWHINMEYSRDGIRFLNSRAAIKGNNQGELQINFININPDDITTEIHKLVANSFVIIHRNSFQPEEKSGLISNKITAAAIY